MSRYSYKVEKLLKESKSPSLNILLEKEGPEEEETPASDDEGIPADPFNDNESEDEGGEDSKPNANPKAADDKAADDQAAEEGAGDEAEGDDKSNTSESLKDELEDLKRKVNDSKKAEIKISETSDEFPESIEGSLFDDIDRARAFESKLYNTQGIKAFIFEAEDDSNKKIADSIESLQSALDSEENQLPDPYELAQIANKYFNRFDEVDRAIYIIKLVAIYFKKIINPDKDKVFDEFIDNFLAILQKDGINIELDHSQAVKYKTAVGARTAG